MATSAPAAMMKGRGAAFDKTQPQAEWVVRLINDKKQTADGEPAGAANAAPALRGYDRQRDGTRLAAWLRAHPEWSDRKNREGGRVRPQDGGDRQGGVGGRW